MPVVLTGCLDKWPAYGKWSIDFFRANYADAQVGAAPRADPLPHCRTAALWTQLELPHRRAEIGRAHV